MTKNDINPDVSHFKAVNAFIFAGSFSVGVMKAGFDLQKVLEIADNQPEANAFYFKKNVEDVPVILPSEWENNEYLDALKNDGIDLMCCNCPCSSLSQINRNASVDGKNNVHFYRLFNIFKHVQPKVFVIENAPTLVKLGLPILKDLVEQLSSMYRITIIRDCAGNHNVAMRRQRTLVVGWNRNAFSSHPIVQQDAQQHRTVKDEIGDLYNSDVNDCPSETVDEISDLYKYADPKMSVMTSLAQHCITDPDKSGKEINERLAGTRYLKEVKRIMDKLLAKRNYWDKSPYKLSDDGFFPSLTSVTEYIHPKQPRTLNLHEIARIMNYPDGYDFHDPQHQCKIPVVQAIAQGVPANFGMYIASQARKALEGNLDMLDDSNADVVFQHHCRHKYSTFTKEAFHETKDLFEMPNAKTLTK